MAEKSYAEAIRVLQHRLGEQWEATEAHGCEEMQRILQKELRYSRHEAETAINTLIKTGAIRYRREVGRSAAGEARVAPAGQAGALGLGLGSVGGTPGVPDEPIGLGHWQIGHEEGVATERKGQINPIHD